MTRRSAVTPRPAGTPARRRRLLTSAVVLAVAGTAVALTVPALADTNEVPPGAASDLVDASDPGVAPLVVAAVGRDLGLDTEQAHTRLTREHQASRTEPALRASLGSRFGGAWYAPGSQKLVVGVTDEAAAAKVRASGAEPRIVSRGETELDGIKQRLDGARQRAANTVTAWYVDVATNSVVVTAKPGAEADARALVAASGAPAAAVRVETSADAPRPLFDVRGGDAFFIDNRARCSIGFAVQGGFVTAGHCGKAGSTTAGFNKTSQGTFKASSFPGNDYAFVAVNSNWSPVGVVNDFDGGTVPVAGSQEAAVGATICRSGSTTGTHCGTIQAKNVTVNYAEGSVSGLTRTTVCAEPGDSGGSWLSGDQAQGVTSGGSGDCTRGGTTFFQPVNEILTANNLKLVTSTGQGGGQSPTPSPSATRSPSRSATPSTTAPSSPSAPRSSSPAASPSRSTPSQVSPTRPSPSQPNSPSRPATPSGSASTPPGSNPPGSEVCTGLEAAQSGTLSGTGAQRTVPRSGYFRAGNGRHVGCLSESTAADFDLYLQRWTGRRWETVARGDDAGAGGTERLEFTGTGGYYRYRVVSVTGSGSFLLGADVP